ncbi:MAG: Fic family protein [Candidatus Krumholzibacteria bacterium]|nr:Fic family protein [Candidatus Krumholzibacteria bacterium]
MKNDQSKLAGALNSLRELQKEGRSVFRSSEFSRLQRERLLRQGYLVGVMRGWLLSSNPGADAEDATPWYSSFWEFIAAYCENRWGEAWHLAPEASLLLHVEEWAIPQQLLVHSPKAGNNPVDLPFQSSLLAVKPTRKTAGQEVRIVRGLRLLPAEDALARLPQSCFRTRSREIQTALATLVDIPRLLRIVLENGQPIVAGRLAGALRHLGRNDGADEIVGTMRSAGHDTREVNPFRDAQEPVLGGLGASPLSSRLEGFWLAMREDVLNHFPAPRGRHPDIAARLQQVNERYSMDAYHSLSIEGYRVSDELIEEVRSENWDPDAADKGSRDAMAAKGYALAFSALRSSLERILQGEDAVAVTRLEHRTWYRELFAPSVAAGLVEARDLAGYRSEAVFIRKSRHVPPRAMLLPEAMGTYFDLLESEPSPAVQAVLSHWLLGYIHPYLDGNGRMARFLMNVMFVAGGYPWLVIHTRDRDEYMAALESASVHCDIVPFARFLGARMFADE